MSVGPRPALDLAAARARADEEIQTHLPRHGFARTETGGGWMYVHGTIWVTLEVRAANDLEGDWELTRIRVEPVERRHGAAGAALRELAAAADAADAAITLTPERFGMGASLRGALSDRQPRAWYGRHGYRRLPGGRWRRKPSPVEPA